MGYNIHITRREYYSEDGNAIPLEEWLALAQADAELTLEWNDNEWAEVNWRGVSGCENLFTYFGGGILTKMPRNECKDAIIDKMVQIAARLGARVLGDDDEIYLGQGHVTHPQE